MDRVGRENFQLFSYTNASMHQQSTRWRHGVRAVQVETSVNPSAKWLHITISEMDTPLGGTRTQLMLGCGTLRYTIAS